jgi:hypothetical protein
MKRAHLVLGFYVDREKQVEMNTFVQREVMAMVFPDACA